MFFTFRFLIILPMKNIMCHDMMLSNPMMLMCMRSHHSHIECHMSLDGVSVSIRVTGCWISHLTYNKQDLSIHRGHQYFCCNLLLYCSGYVYILNKEHLCCLKYISIDEGVLCWLILDMLSIVINFWFWYSILGGISHMHSWDFICCAIKLIGIYLWWVPSVRLIVMKFVKIWYRYIGDHTILWWGFLSWDCMMHPQHSPMIFFLLLH